VTESLQYLREVMQDKQTDLAKVVTGFPECVALGVDDAPPGLKYAVEFVAEEWGVRGNAAQRAFARKPKALGCRVDCVGECQGQCHWCWFKLSGKPRIA
jgi:hypothetical protein